MLAQDTTAAACASDHQWLFAEWKCLFLSKHVDQSPPQQYLQCHTYDIDGFLHVGVARALSELLTDPHAKATDGYASLWKEKGSWSGDLEEYSGGKKKENMHKDEISPPPTRQHLHGAE